MGVSVYVLAYNEEKRISSVIKGLKKFDKIIVHDKSSTDKTAELAKTLGADVITTPYYNDTAPIEVHETIKDYLLNNQSNEWVLMLTSSDIIHYKLYDEIIKAIEKNNNICDVIEVPMYRYSMGVVGKHTFYGDIEYKPILWKTNIYPVKVTKVHESPLEEENKFRMQCADRKIAIYHLTHPNLEMVMDRHWRYAVQYVEDSLREGKSRENIMKYSLKECIRLIIKFFKKKIFKTRTEGVAQLAMLIMYNCMIYLNAFFSKEKELEILQVYNNIIDECKGN